jgi:hypothetical protein
MSKLVDAVLLERYMRTGMLRSIENDCGTRLVGTNSNRRVKRVCRVTSSCAMRMMVWVRYPPHPLYA